MPGSTTLSPYKPSVFIASSSEGLKIARAVKQQFSDYDEVDLWTENVFDLNRSYLESLLRKVNLYDFAILCLTADDLLESRGQTQKSPFATTCYSSWGCSWEGLDPIVPLCCTRRGVRVLSDFQGISVSTFKQPQNDNYMSAVGNACTAIRNAMEKAMEIERNQDFSRQPPWRSAISTTSS